MINRVVLLLLGICISFVANAQEAESDSLSFDANQILEYYLEAQAKDSLLNYQTGTIMIGDGLATLNLDEGFKYLDEKEADKIITEAWGNPPQETLGMIFPDSLNPYWDAWGIIIGFEQEGYIKDEDAQEIDYDEMLKELQDEALASSEERRNLGYEGYELVGWAEAPYYDAETKKLYWAKELRFDGMDASTLNYDIRILGRKGFLRMNAVADMESIEDVKNGMSVLLNKVEFTEGNTYFDFDPEIDEVAAYGIGALVAGKLAAKAGLLKVVGIFLAKFWKFILIGVAAVGGVFRKMWGGGGKEQRDV